jgi:hypothetical protein
LHNRVNESEGAAGKFKGRINGGIVAGEADVICFGSGLVVNLKEDATGCSKARDDGVAIAGAKVGFDGDDISGFDDGFHGVSFNIKGEGVGVPGFGVDGFFDLGGKVVVGEVFSAGAGEGNDGDAASGEGRGPDLVEFADWIKMEFKASGDLVNFNFVALFF